MESSDEELVRRVANEVEAFATLYRRHYPRVLNYLFRCTIDVDAAEELTGRTFLKAMKGLAGYRGTAPFRAWLLGIAANEARMWFRSRRRKPEMGLSDEQWERITFGDRPDLLLEERERRMLEFIRVHRAILRLPAKYQVVITLRYFQELSNDEIAAALGKRVGTVKSLISRGLARLRDAIQVAHEGNEP